MIVAQDGSERGYSANAASLRDILRVSGWADATDPDIACKMLQHISPPEPSIAEGVEGLLQYAAAREETTVIFAEITQKADPARRSREHGRAQATYPPSLSATTPIPSRLCVSGAASGLRRRAHSR
jgi:hypothetical protein